MGCGCGDALNAMTGGSPKGTKMELEKKDALMEKAKRYKIKGRWSMRKDELIAAIRQKQKEIGNKIAKRGRA